MKTKVLILGLICLCLFACKKVVKNPHSSESLDPPNITHFSATHLLSRQFTLSWAVRNATAVRIDQGVGKVDASGSMEVEVFETTTFTLTATNAIGKKTASCVAEPPERTMLEITTIPEPPVFTYHPYEGEEPNPPLDWSSSSANFIIVITETNGVGGKVELRLHTFIVGESRCSKKNPLHWERFEPYGVIKVLVNKRVPCRPTTMILHLDGYDDNNCIIDTQVGIPFIYEN